MTAPAAAEVWQRRYPARPFLAASVAVVRDGRVLVAARGRPPMQGVFSLPGGLVEAGETLAEAALRELHEEVGLAAEIVAVLAPIEIVERDGDRVLHHYVVLPHAARWLGGEPVTGPEALSLRWVDAADILTLPTTRGLPAVIAGALAAVAEAGAAA
ncbi:MAG: NUDIX hydrolase [Methylobacterium frigidaeris]